MKMRRAKGNGKGKKKIGALRGISYELKPTLSKGQKDDTDGLMERCCGCSQYDRAGVSSNNWLWCDF